MHDLLPSACGANFMVRWSMASALFLGSWAALMGPMIYGKSAPDTFAPFTSQYCSDYSL
jgi:hypothetical protein